MSRSDGTVNGSFASGSSILDRPLIDIGYSVAVIAVAVKSRHTCPVEKGRTRGRPAIPLDRIVTTALQIVDDEGADALSMRTLAQRLDSGPPTLYRHVTGRGGIA